MIIHRKRQYCTLDKYVIVTEYTHCSKQYQAVTYILRNTLRLEQNGLHFAEDFLKFLSTKCLYYDSDFTTVWSQGTTYSFKQLMFNVNFAINFSI